MIRILLYSTILIVSKYLGVEGPWWLIILSIFAVEILFSRWNRQQRISALTTEQTMGTLIALLRIRSAEVGAMYSSIRNYQTEVGDGLWIPHFIAELLSAAKWNIYQEQSSKREESYRKRARTLYDKRFSYNPFFGVLDEPCLTDIAVAMLYWSSLDSTIKLLETIQCDLNLNKHVSALLRQYRWIRLLSLNGSYSILFKNWRPLSDIIRLRYELLRHHWKELLHSHQFTALTAYAGGQLKLPYSLESIWTEGQMLTDMERNLDSALSQKNANSHGWGGAGEKAFFQHLESNPIWTKLHGYSNPFISPETSFETEPESRNN